MKADPALAEKINELTLFPSHSHLFTLRLWAEALGDGQTEWRGKLQHVTSGEVRYLRDWATLLSVLQGILAETTRDGKNASL